MARGDYITRRVTESRDVDIYEVTDTSQLKLLGTITTSGKTNNKELATKYGVNKVLTQTKQTNTVTYGVLVDDFMKIAKKLTNSEEKENDNN